VKLTEVNFSQSRHLASQRFCMFQWVHSQEPT